MERPMGFILRSGGRISENAASARERAILTADSGVCLTSDDLNYHGVVFGSTGSGKTADVILPAILNLIRAGHTLIVLAVKTSLKAQIQALARSAGRGDDVRIYGTDPEAERLNILEDMTDSEVYEFFDALTREHIGDEKSHNYSFYAKGNRQAADIVLLFRYLRRAFPHMIPTPARVLETLNDAESCRRLWSCFKKRVYDRGNKKQRRFVRLIESNDFHPLNAFPKTSEESLHEQRGYNLGVIRLALQCLIEAPGMLERFSHPEGRGLNMERVIDENNIALIDFRPGAGRAAASMGRVILNHIYKAILARGATLPQGRKVCVVIDEFQMVADLSTNAWSDSGFVSVAREYNGVFLAATQSLAALSSRAANLGEVESLISNCNSRLVFYTDDPLTQKMARRHEPDIDLTLLQPGEAFVLRYDCETRRHIPGRETFQRAYEETREILKDVRPAPPAPEDPLDTMDLEEMLDLAERRTQTSSREQM